MQGARGFPSIMSMKYQQTRVHGGRQPGTKQLLHIVRVTPLISLTLVECLKSTTDVGQTIGQMSQRTVMSVAISSCIHGALVVMSISTRSPGGQVTMWGLAISSYSKRYTEPASSGDGYVNKRLVGAHLGKMT